MRHKTFVIIESIERFKFWSRLKEIEKLTVLTIKESVYIACSKNKIKCIKFDYQEVDFKKLKLS